MWDLLLRRVQRLCEAPVRHFLATMEDGGQLLVSWQAEVPSLDDINLGTAAYEGQVMALADSRQRFDFTLVPQVAYEDGVCHFIWLRGSRLQYPHLIGARLLFRLQEDGTFELLMADPHLEMCMHHNDHEDQEYARAFIVLAHLLAVVVLQDGQGVVGRFVDDPGVQRH